MVDLLDKYVLAINDVLWTYVIVALLIVAGLYFTIRSRFVQFRFIKEMFRLLGEGMGKKDGISSFQAFCISTASRVGVGNIAGVAMAIAIGGPGAVFWMWLIALIGSASAFIEATLAQVYKVKDGEYVSRRTRLLYGKRAQQAVDGDFVCDPDHLVLGLVFNSVQANTITVAFESTYGINRAVLGLIIAAVFAIIIFGGIKRVARFTEWIVPIMAVIYILLALYVVLTNITQLPAVFKQIFAGAFGLEQAIGGGIGAAMMQGIKRGLFSNEAGMGSAPNAAATATVSHPAKQGLIQALGVFVDTLIICSCTSMIVLFSSAFTHDNLSGIEIAQLALNQQVGVWAEHFLTISILLFAFSSLIGNYYYGETNIEFIRENKTWLLIYRLAVIAMVIWGSITQVQVVWDLADLFMGLMAILNLIAILLLGKVAFAVLQNYHQQLKEGKNPSFTSDQIKDLANADCWEKSESTRRTG